METQDFSRKIIDILSQGTVEIIFKSHRQDKTIQESVGYCSVPDGIYNKADQELMLKLKNAIIRALEEDY